MATKDKSGMDGGRISLIGALLVATVSGLVIKVIGDPLVEFMGPKLENFFEDIEDFWDDTGETIEDWLDRD